jgi:HAD superfamily hydrolase (TIGR01509 family)
MIVKVKAILFDLGGTLDGDGVHWLDRFDEVYKQEGVPVTWARLREAFDFAERRAANDAAMMEAPFSSMVRSHVAWQLEHLGIDAKRLSEAIASTFIAQVLKVAARNADLLRDLAARGLLLGVISNGCGNTAALCDDFGFTPSLRVVLDSRRVGLSKPDSRFFARAAEMLGVMPRDVLMVGDSIERDIVPAKALGMRTAQVGGEPQTADLRIRSLAELRDIVVLAE